MGWDENWMDLCVCVCVRRCSMIFKWLVRLFLFMFWTLRCYLLVASCLGVGLGFGVWFGLAMKMYMYMYILVSHD